MKKLFVIAFAVMAIAMIAPNKAEAAYFDGAAVGGIFGGGSGLSGGAVTGKFENIPVMFGVDLGYSWGGFGLGVTADWWLFTKELGTIGDVVTVHIYLGPGVGVEFGGLGYLYGPSIGVSARMPVGFSWFVQQPGWEKWEIITQFTLGVRVLQVSNLGSNIQALYVVGVPIIGSGSFNFLYGVSFSGGAGFRYWF